MEVKPKKAQTTTEHPLELPDGTRIEVGRDLSTPSAGPGFDPFEKHKTEPDKFYYRGLNTRRTYLDKRLAQGYEIVPDQENPYGDLILGRIPWEKRNQRVKSKDDKAASMQAVAVDQFKEEAQRAGVKTFKES